ncbi:MAG TPA: DUF4232 domain-containing protein [Streptosporangiaceae bacterium]|nr:DUF4232 domain-containing protein [Streptosporangiaceae bacterium]
MRPILIATLAALGAVTCACSSSSPTAQPTRTVTITANAAAGRSATPAPTPSPTSLIAARCQLKHLSASAGAPQGYRNGLQLVIVLSNTGTAACTLSGYPTVTQAGGTPAAEIGQPAIRNPATPHTVVTVPPNGDASVMLQIANSAGNLLGTCKPVKATSLLVVPPHETGALHVAFGSTACKGTAKLMTVTAVQQGSGG